VARRDIGRNGYQALGRRQTAASLLPRRQRGGQSAAEAQYREHLAAFCKLVLQIRSSLYFAVGVRDCCYLLEREGLRKGDFDDAEDLITACRKSGDLPLDIRAEDATRAAVGIEQLDGNDISGEVAHPRDQAHSSTRRLASGTVKTPTSRRQSKSSASASRSPNRSIRWTTPYRF
jgi:hypothetical protein